MSDIGNFTLGRGKLYFDRFEKDVQVVAKTIGEGERYLGNSPEVAFTSDTETLDHFNSDEGVKEKNLSVLLSINRSGSFTLDDVSPENLALLFLGESMSLTQVAATAQSEDITVKLGRFYQLGTSLTLPSGVRSVDTVVVKKGTADVVKEGNYDIDLATARLFIHADAVEIEEDDVLTVTFDVKASTRDMVISKSNAIYGALRYIAANPVGKNRDVFAPYVKLSPTGDYNLKGDDWQQMNFAFDVLKKAEGIESVYIDGRAI